MKKIIAFIFASAFATSAVAEGYGSISVGRQEDRNVDHWYNIIDLSAGWKIDRNNIVSAEITLQEDSVYPWNPNDGDRAINGNYYGLKYNYVFDQTNGFTPYVGVGLGIVETNEVVGLTKTLECDSNQNVCWQDESFPVGGVEIGTLYNFTNEFYADLGVRYRDSFESKYDYSNTRVDLGLHYNVTPVDVVGVSYGYTTGDLEQNTVKIGYTRRF